MADPETYRIERLTPAHDRDYLRFFDHERGPAFADNPDWRRRGVARALLDGALENFAARGIFVVDAFPWNVGAEDTAATDHYHGSPALFAAAGFIEIARHETLTVVRRAPGLRT